MTKNVNQIVDGYLSGDRKQEAEACILYEGLYSVEEIQSEAVCSGHFVPNTQVEIDIYQLHRLEEFLSEKRIEALENGAKPTKREMQLYRKVILADAKDNGGNADVNPAFGFTG